MGILIPAVDFIALSIKKVSFSLKITKLKAIYWLILLRLIAGWFRPVEDIVSLITLNVSILFI